MAQHEGLSRFLGERFFFLHFHFATPVLTVLLKLHLEWQRAGWRAVGERQVRIVTGAGIPLYNFERFAEE
jgi:hypothetical protein